MFRPIVRLWLLIFVPFAILPFTFLSGIVVPYTALWGHAVFHLIYLPILAAGLWALWRFVREPSNLALRVIAALMLLCQTSGLFGHAEMDGLVMKEPLRGYSVTPMLDTKTFNDLYDVRRLLEPFAARRAAERRDDRVLGLLDRELDEMRRLVGTSAAPTGSTYHDYHAFAMQDARFHEAIAGTSGNSLLSDTLRRLRSHLRLYRLYHRFYTIDIGAATVLEHARILEAIRAGDAGRAEAAMLDHINRSMKRSEGARVRSGNRKS